MATRIEKTRNLVSAQSIAFIRPINLMLRLVGAKPTTRINVFFDMINVNELCSTDLTTNLVGELTTILAIPGGKFTTGSKTIVLTDADTLDQLNVTGSTFSSGTAVFTSTGVHQTFRPTTTTITTNTVFIDQVGDRGAPTVINDPGPADPLAQSFFTYGVKGGMFVTGIGLYFNSKDPILPVRVDIREMVNGYPASRWPKNADYVITKPASDVVISTNASAETKFVFPVPVYLEEDKDYCFVVFSNSNRYNLFSSKMGEKSIETGKRIFDQPFIGSLFKSENNITWTAEQFEDLKFRIYQAEFYPNRAGTLTLNVSPEYWGVPGTSFTTTLNSETIRVTMTVKHGLTVSSKVNIIGVVGAIYNGIVNSAFTGTRTVSRVVDEYTFEYNADAQASSSGPVITSGTIVSIDIMTRGSNYTYAVVNFSGGGGSGAAATAEIRDGQVVRVDITNIGSGYITAPVISITGDGSGATASAAIDAMFSVLTNMTVTSIAPNIPIKLYDTNRVSTSVNLTNMPYGNSSISPYSNGGAFTIAPDKRTQLPSYSVIASSFNEAESMAGVPSMAVTYSFYTENSNVSPVIDMRNSPSMLAYSNNLRNQSGEQVTATNATGTISSISIINAGSGYVNTPTVSIVGDGTDATAVAVLGTTAVSRILINNGGSGYTTPPNVAIVGDGSGAIASAVLSPVAIASVAVTEAGSGYVTAPAVTFIGGGGGSGATALATLAPTSIESLTLTNGGSGYTSAPTVTFSGGGTGTIVRSNILPTSIESLTLTNGGSGYTSAPTVTFSGGGTGAAAQVTLAPTSVGLVSLSNSGSGYTSAPTVTFSGGGGTGAAATAQVDGNTFIVSITLTNGGSGYTSAPTVTFSGGGGTGAVAVATLSTRSIGSVTLTNGGSGFTTFPTVTFSGGGGGTGAAATVTVLPSSIESLTLTNGGSGYTTIPSVTFSGGGGTGAAATATLSPSSVQLINITNGGSGYTTIPSVTFSGGGGTGAAATATLSTRSIGSVTLTNGGSGYTYAPTVTLVGGGGTGATATAEIAGRNITSIQVINAGQNYSRIPEVIITRAEDSSGVDAIALPVLTTFNSEVSPFNGTNTSRYITKLIKLETLSNGINLFSEIYSENESSVDWYIRTSMSGSTLDHKTMNWIPLICDIDRNKSSNIDEKFDYKFYKYDLPYFDTYDLKCVMRSSNPVKAPKVFNFRAILVA